MSSASPEVIDYLRSQLTRNPIHQSGDIVRARAKELDLQTSQASPPSNAPSSAQRQQVRDELEEIRQACFLDSPAELLDRLKSAEVDGFPDLAALAERLEVIVRNRQRLEQLANDRRFDFDFLSVFQKVLLTPARDVVILKEQVVANFRHRQLRRRGQQMIRLLQSELPQLYALESAWLDELLRYSARNNLWATTSNDSPVSKQPAEESGNSYMPVWGVILLLVIGARVAMQANRTARDSTPNTTYTAPDIQILANVPDEAFDAWIERLREERAKSGDEGSSSDPGTTAGPPEKELDNVMDGMEYYQQRRDADPTVPQFSDPDFAPYPESSSPYEPFSPFDSVEP